MRKYSLIGKREHHDSCEDIRRSNQALRCGDAETHSITQNDGQEVGDSVRGGSGQTEQASEAPDLEISSMFEIVCQVESGDCQSPF